jgi:hypothetical protein
MRPTQLQVCCLGSPALFHSARAAARRAHGTSEADMLSHLNALQATRAAAHVEVIQGCRSLYQDGMRIESALPALEASE